MPLKEGYGDPLEDDFELADASLGRLGDLRDFYQRNLDAEIDATRARGGPPGRTSDLERELADKHHRTDAEIFDRLVDIHEARPQRARTVDEQKRARKTNDPAKWARDPRRWDYPGIDTPPWTPDDGM